eukprot:4207195-Pyramimonas_sp.AAC.1
MGMYPAWGPITVQACVYLQNDSSKTCFKIKTSPHFTGPPVPITARVCTQHPRGPSQKIPSKISFVRSIDSATSTASLLSSVVVVCVGPPPIATPLWLP